MAHPVILRGLVDRYHELLAQDSAQGSQEARCQLEDVTYTLCVSTGTRTADEALAVAEQQLTAALRDPALRVGRPLDAQLTAS